MKTLGMALLMLLAMVIFVSPAISAEEDILLIVYQGALSQNYENSVIMGDAVVNLLDSARQSNISDIKIKRLKQKWHQILDTAAIKAQEGLKLIREFPVGSTLKERVRVLTEISDCLTEALKKNSQAASSLSVFYELMIKKLRLKGV